MQLCLVRVAKSANQFTARARQIMTSENPSPVTPDTAIPASPQGSEVRGDDAIVQFIVKHRAVPYRVLNKRFFSGKSCAQVVKRLSRPQAERRGESAMLISHTRALGTGTKKQSYVQPSAAACRRFGASEKRSEPFGPAALAMHIALAWFCVMEKRPRYLASREELLPLLGVETPRANVPHLLATKEELGHPTLLRVYHAINDVSCSVKHLTALIGDLQRKPLLASWIRDRDYGIAVMCTTSQNLAALRKSLGKCYELHGITVITGLGPTPETISTLS